MNAPNAKSPTNATPSRRSRSGEGYLDNESRTLTSQPHRRGRPPDGHGEEEVDDVDGDDRGAHCSTDGHADTCRPSRGVVAVVAVDQDHDHGEDQYLAERPQHVARRQEEVEVV